MRGRGAGEGEAARSFVAALRERGVELLAEGESLSVRAPRGLLSDTDRQALRERKGELLAYLAAEGPGAGGVKADPGRRHEPFPLTDIQEAYLVGRSLSLGNVGCHAYRELEGVKVDVDRLERGLELLVERHDMLRVVFDGDGRQRILPRSEVPPVRIERTYLTSLPGSEQEAELLRLRERLSHRVFDPAAWPLFEVRATRHRGGTRLHVGIDLLLADAASLLLLFREWEELARDPGARLPLLPVAFRDFVVAQRAAEDRGDLRRDEAYWRERGPALPGGPELPLAVNPAAIERPHFTRRSARLSPESWRRLRERGARRGLTPSAVVCAAFSEVLGAWSRHGERLALTLTFFSRPPESPELAGVVGDFTSTILLEVDRSGATFAERAASLRDRLAADLEHAGWSGVRVLRERQRSGGDANAVPVVFTSALGLRSGPEGAGRVDASALDWLGATVYEVTQTPGVWLDHHVLEERGGLVFGWDSVDALFPAGLTEGMFGAYEGLLEALASGEEAWEGDPELVPAGQLSARREANATAGTVPEGLLHEPFERQAASRPEAVALASSRRRMSYGELEGDANALGRRLRGLGVGPGKLAAVVMEKGWEQVVGVLGILKAGGAYLPVDAGLPVERIAYLLRNGGVSVAVVQPWVAGRLEFPAGVEVVTVAEPEGAGGSESAGASRLEAQAKPEDVAYVIYTSGSTGEPKGVVIDHRGALNTCVDVNRTHGIGPGDRVLGISSLSFDLSVWDLFGVLGAGGTVVLPEPEAQRDPSRWLSLMESEGVTVWNSVPALVEMLTTYVGGGRLPESLRLVLMSGDWIPVTLPGAIRRAGRDGIELVSMGGATEASIWSIRYPIGAVGEGWTSIPYGRAMANQGFHVLDGGMRERPEWVAGELYIGGIGLAKGYLGDAEKTAAKFVIHPKTGERLYRTGDWGRWLPGGVIEFLGREDQQVKVQGHRIELGEVEAALGRLPGVAAAAVAVAGEGSDRRLVAFVAEVKGARLAPSEAQSARLAPSGGSPAEESDGSAIAPVGSLRDPMERLDFRLRRPGIREAGSAASVALPLPAGHGGRRDLWTERRTHRRFGPLPVPLDALSALLSALVPVDEASAPFAKYRYPSAGDLYPVQLLVVPRPGRVEGLGEGVHYHHPPTHRLVRVDGGAAPGGEIHFDSNRSIHDSSAFTLFLVYEREAIEPLYGPLARDFALLEAGAILQLLMMEAPALGLGLCPVGAVREGASRALGLTVSQELLHTIVGGAVPDGRAGRYPGGDRAASLRAGLRALLPDQMVPATFVLLPRLPLTVNGKVDRAALPLPAPPAGPGPRPRTPPAGGSAEERVAAIVGSILGLAIPPRDENLFDLGGNSLHVVRIHRLLVEEFGRDIAVVDVFRHPTISSLARFLDGAGGEGEPARRGEERAARRLALRARRGEEP